MPSVGETGRQIADSLRDAILQGELPPGTRVGQELLAKQFDTSRIPVREALKILEAEGLVTIVANAGAWVARLDAFEFDQIYKLREQVEALAIRESIDGLNSEHVGDLHRLVKAIESADDVESFLSLDREFHLLTYAGARFGLLHELVQRFWNSTQHYRRALAKARDPEQLWTSDAEHRLIVNAIERRDHDLAAYLVLGHIRRTRVDLGAKPELFS